MNYEFIPNKVMINNEILKNNKDEFLKLQIRYKQAFEGLLKKIVNFEDFDTWIKCNINELPTVDDKKVNFYRKFSILNSEYIYLRNNIHIERLSINELNELKNSISEEFLLRTYKKVLFEDGNYTFIGYVTDEDMVMSKSIVFEVAFDAKKCDTLEEINFFKNYNEQIYEIIAKPVKDRLNCDVSIHRYSAIPELFIDESKQINL